MSEQTRLGRILEGFMSVEKADRNAAQSALGDMANEGLSVEDATHVLRAAGQKFPAEGQWPDPCESIVRTFLDRMQPDLVVPMIEAFPHYSKKGREIAMNCLARTAGESFKRGYAELIRRYARHGLVEQLTTYVLSADSAPERAIVVNAFVEHLDVQVLAGQIESCLANWLDKGELSTLQLRPAVIPLCGNLQSCLQAAEPMQQAHGVRWMWTDEYRELRGRLGAMLDLAGCFEGTAGLEELRRGLNLSDPKLKCWALVSLVRRGQPVPESPLQAAAAFDESRYLLFDRLKKQGRMDLFPAQWLKQRWLAQADMVHWLTFGTELDSVPDEIELMKAVSYLDSDGERMDYFLFRFRTFEPHWAAKRGWTAGGSGPFPRREQLSADHAGYTFSSFKAWDSMSADEHIDSLIDVVGRSIESLEPD